MIKIIIPKLSLRAKEAEIVKWHKKEGDHVRKDELLLEIITEKSNVEIEAPESGILTRVAYKEGDIVKVGETIALIITEGEKPPSPEPTPKTVRSTPAAKGLCKNSSITIEDVYQTLGKEPITERDVRTYLAMIRKEAGAEVPEAELPFETIKLSLTRKIIARRMQESASEKPHIYLFSEVEMGSLLKIKENISKRMEGRDIRITLIDLIMKITAKVLTEFPLFNAIIIEEKDDLILKRYKHINIGIAVTTEQGLVVPVIHNAGVKDIAEIARIKNELVTKARKNKLTLNDITGGSFTITNLGMFDVVNFIPIINAPEIAILSLGTIQKKLWLDGDNILKLPVMSVCLACDHRALDGADGAQFLQRFKYLIENPPEFFTE